MKHMKKFIIAAVIVLTMAACADTNTAEITSAESTVSETTAATVSETDTLSAESEETTAETAVEDLKTDKSDELAEDEVDIEPIEDEEPVEDYGVFSPSKLNYIFSSEENTNYVEITENTKFYECHCSQDNVVTDENSFKNNDAIQKAKELLKNSDKVSADIESIREALKEGMFNAFAFKEQMSGDINFRFTQGITADFDGNGKEESFMVFDTYMGEESISVFANAHHLTDNDLSYIVFADSSDNVQIIGEQSVEIELYELQYSGFSHLAFEGGYNNNTYTAHYYSVHGNEVKHEMEQSFVGDIADGFALQQHTPQAATSYLLFWNEELGKYVTPCVEALSDEDEKLILDMLPLDDMDHEMVAAIKDQDISVIGRKFFNTGVIGGMGYHKTFFYENGKFIDRESEEFYPLSAISRYGYPDVPIAVNFDYDKALKNLIPLED